MLGELERAIDELSLEADGEVIARAFVLLDRLTAKLTGAVGDFDVGERWREDGTTSVTAWLRHRARRSGRGAAACAKTARRLRRLPVTASAFGDGRLSGGHLQAVVANVTERTVELFAEHEATVVPTLTDLPVADAALVMQRWARRAEALLDDRDTPPESERSLHLSRTLDGRRQLTGHLDAEAGALVETALRLAGTDDVDGEPARRPTQRRADALVDIVRWFLDHQHGHRSGRHRPHVNVTVDLAALEGRDRQGHLVDGTPLDAATIGRLLCDCGVHRVVTAGRSSILDHGTTTRTIPAPLWSVLVIRDRHCRFPGCDRPPEWCEAHHIVWYSEGGTTDPANLALQCTRHHHLLHTPGWHAKLLPEGTLEVTTPTGDTLRSHPPP